MQAPQQPRVKRQVPSGGRGPLLGNSPMHRDVKASVLSTQRIALVQHSGELSV